MNLRIIQQEIAKFIDFSKYSYSKRVDFNVVILSLSLNRKNMSAPTNTRDPP